MFGFRLDKWLKHSVLFVSIFIILVLAWSSFSFLDFDSSIKHNLKTLIYLARSAYHSVFFATNEDVFEPYVHRTVSPDGMRQVFIPSGEFSMGEKEGYHSVNSPIHQVTVGNYWIDAIEVPNSMYKMCVDQGSCSPPAIENHFYPNPLFRSYPIVYVTWQQAVTYCSWAKRDLPTEAEWEKAARGFEGGLYPWGNMHPNPGFGNFEGKIGTIVSSYTYQNGISPYGALNMVGNVREWVGDWFNPTYYQRSPNFEPTGAKQGSYKVLRGGSYLDPSDRLFVFYRFFHEPKSPGINRGFRCVSRSR